MIYNWEIFLCIIRVIFSLFTLCFPPVLPPPLAAHLLQSTCPPPPLSSLPPTVSSASVAHLPAARLMSADDAGGSLADWLDNLLNRVGAASTAGTQPASGRARALAAARIRPRALWHSGRQAIRITLSLTARRGQHVLEETGVWLTLLKKISSLLAVSVSTVYMWSLRAMEGGQEGGWEREGEREEMIKGQTAAADSQKFNKQYTHFFSLPLFSPCRLQTTSENGAFV